MGVQTRPETSFRLPEEQVGKGRGEALDLLREVAALLLLAQERAREGKSEKKPGEGKWYTSTPRWGGGPGGEVGNAAGNSDEETSKKEDKKFGRTKSRRTSAAEAYKTLHPGMGTWDPKTTYLAIGKREESEVDDVSPLTVILGSQGTPCSQLKLKSIGLPHIFHQSPRVHLAPQCAPIVHLLS